MSLAWEVTDLDVRHVAEKHDTQLTDAQVEEVLDTLDHDAVEKAALRGNEMDEQTEYAYGEIEEQMILEGLYISDPKRFGV